jgi:arginyl-tRNA synthetase
MGYFCHMSITDKIRPLVQEVIQQLYNKSIGAGDLTINVTKPEFEGDYTLVLFSFVKQVGKKPEVLGQEIGDRLVAQNSALITKFNVIKGFLNLTIADDYWKAHLHENFRKEDYGIVKGRNAKLMVEYSSPNTNKPLHLGHLRNNFLGWSVARIMEALGNEVIKSCVVNDRGIHICKSMIAWEMFANGSTPGSTNTKGDHFVGDYYVKFNDAYKQEVEELVRSGMKKEEAEKEAPILKKAQEMLYQWEKGDTRVIELWKRMNGWVYEGFDVTYRRIGSDFAKMYYESETYLLGKKIVDEGLEKGVFFRKEDGSVWIDLTGEGLDEKLVLRKDGTSVYITQDLGLADQKYADFRYDQSLYVIADEQNYHMKVLQLILDKMDKPYAKGIQHLSYGMVELPTGRMKSREGTVVDADDLIEEMVEVARAKTEELGKVKDFEKEELNLLYDTIALGALKFFLLRVDPKKRMIFNPEESIDFHGFTGPFVQYTYARIRSILRKADEAGINYSAAESTSPLSLLEKNLIVSLEQFPTVLSQAGAEHDPSVIAIYVYNLAKTFNSFYTIHSVMNAESEVKKALRLRMCSMTANVIRTGMAMLGIRVPERM